MASEQVALEGVAGITLAKLWFEIGRLLDKQITRCQKLRIISYLLVKPGCRLKALLRLSFVEFKC